MAPPPNTRKRPAPESSAAYQPAYTSASPSNYPEIDSHISDDQFLEYGYRPKLPGENADPNGAPSPQPTYTSASRPNSTQLTRRSANNQAIMRNQGHGIVAGYRDENVDLHSPQVDSAWADDIDDLKRQAQTAKREAQSKRKQIPPFVQKLASFLDDGKNESLIRWSADGNSFIVEDEDEFAKTLIPELFKHNNYASFVRQLNMYGFHKRVGLADNSMRASEKKAKSPSEYSNPYFRRGHPDLLWLIQKAKNAGKKTRVDNEKNEEDIDEFVEEVPIAPPQRVNAPTAQLAIEQGEVTVPSSQLANVHAELKAIRNQQAQIAGMIQRLKNEHEQLYGQAANFQDQHSRHENSINAILSFLATVYRGSLQAPDGSQQPLANIFTGGISQDSAQSHVLDVGDYEFSQLPVDTQLQRPFRRSPLLLKAAPEDNGRFTPASPSNLESPYGTPQTRAMSQANRRPVDSPTIPNATYNRQPRPQSRPTAAPIGQAHNDFLSVIQNTNARNSAPESPIQEFSNVLNSLEKSGGASPLTSSQRADMLRLINSHGGSTVGDNALTTPTPPPMPTSFDSRLASTKSDIDSLAQMQAKQDESVQSLTNLLQPLSPSGSIPGIGDGREVQPPSLEVEDFLNSQPSYFPYENNGDYFPNADFNAPDTGGGLNFANPNDGDDELFPNISSSNNGGGPSFTQRGNQGHDHLGIDGRPISEHGRVESMPTSEAASPVTFGAADESSSQGPNSPAVDQREPRQSTKRQRLR